MGLDHYIVKVRTLTDEEVRKIDGFGKEQAAQTIPNLSFIYKDELEADVESDCTDLIPYLREVQLAATVLNEKELMRAHGFKNPEDWEQTGSGWYGNSVHYCLRNRKTGEQAELTEDNFHQFEELQPLDFYVCVMEFEVTWRKQYEVQEWFYDHYDHVTNCGFVRTCADELEQLQEDVGVSFDIPDYDYGKGEALFYHEWY
jgi:hypothetical protein